jgi:hypothetical protein
MTSQGVTPCNTAFSGIRKRDSDAGLSLRPIFDDVFQTEVRQGKAARQAADAVGVGPQQER